MPLQLLSRTTTDIVRSRTPSPLATPTSKPQIPTIRLTAATPCDSNPTDDAGRVTPWTTSTVSAAPIAPKSVINGERSRKRLVPKKSKLGLLGTSSAAKTREQDFSDVVRRVGSASAKNGDNAFEIYVDPANDPDLGEILMVKKKKSRLALDGLQWGTLGEVTNVPCVSKSNEKKEKGKRESVSKLKVDENQKWWSIGRGRNDSKEKDKGTDKDRAKSPQPSSEPADVRTRFNSLDSSTLLRRSVRAGNSDSPVEYSRDPPPPIVAPPTLPSATGSGTSKNSVAIRAMRSVRSLARIGSWAQLKNTPNPDAVDAVVVLSKDKESDGKKKKKKKDKEKDKDKDKAKETIRHSGSSFEAGALTASPSGSKRGFKPLGKKASILGLGLPSTMRLRSSRTGSAESSVETASNGNRRLSTESGALLSGGILARGRSGSAMSTVSSLRPMSTKSCGSRESSGSSVAASVKWDEAGLETVKEVRRKDKEAKRKEKEESKKSKKPKSKKDSTRQSSDSQKRTPLAAIFPGIVSGREEDAAEQPPATTTFAVHGTVVDESLTEIPGKRVRPRPASDQPLSRSQLRSLVEGEDENAAMSLLDAATNDLAQLINRLDLEATPGSVEITPTTRRSPSLPGTSFNWMTAESPVKGLRPKDPSMTGLRPEAQSYSKSTSVRLGQNIASWSTLNASISPSVPSPSTVKVNFQDNTATVRTHKQARSPAPAADLSPVFKALRPATSRLPVSKTVAGSFPRASSFISNATDRSPSAMTFGSGHSKTESRTSFSSSPVFKKAQSLLRKRSSLVPHAVLDGDHLPILPEARRSLGLSGTMGGSVGSIAEHDCDGSDPDSDIPDELQVILSNSDQGDDTISFRPKPMAPLSIGPSPNLTLPMDDNLSLKSSPSDIPVFRARVVDEDDHHTELEECGSEDDTKKSFDFTGELRKLRESGVSDRRSFIEQLENAFRTPAKIDLCYDFEDLPSIPKLPTLQDELSRVSDGSFDPPINRPPRSSPPSVNSEPSLLPGSNNVAAASDEELLDVIVPPAPRVTTPDTCPSNGELNRNFKFGGKYPPSKKAGSPLTLSDIIPPPEVARSLFMGSPTSKESPLMASVLANAVEVESISSSRPQARDAARRSYIIPGHHRNSSVLSFTGLDSFAEVRRGFEFSDSRPGFYPPPTAASNRRQRQESIYSIASTSSYGNVLHGGSADPFDYASVAPLPSLRERPSSDNFSFTMPPVVDDTFSFIRRQQPRRRVDSHASSFHFRSSLVHPYSRSQRRPESGISIGPPISLFNRNSTYHRRGDSNTSINSIAQSFANCQRLSWAKRRSDCSVESLLSDFSITNIARPGLGDKMLDSALEHGTPLTSISASPPPSFAGSRRGGKVCLGEYDKRLSYDSVLDSQFEVQKTDSLFERTGYRNSVCSSDSSFFEQSLGEAAAKSPRYRPISSLSIPSVHSPPKDDDTMISMLGGGHVRRRSVTSMIGGSPCIQVERRRNILANPPETVFDRIKNIHPVDHEPSEIPHVIETKPSIASTTDSSKFGDQRMIHAKHGLLERQSLENTALMGDGEDLSGSFRIPVFTRPSCASRSRSSTCTSSSGATTPPLSISDGYSSLSEGSLSSIDLSQLNTLLTSHGPSGAAFDRSRRGHRRRISQARASRTSIYETIEEELISSISPMNSPGYSIPGSTPNTPKFAESVTRTVEPPQVYVVDPETSSVESFSLWDDERGITALRRYYALRDEADDAVTESRRTWLDTPFSLFATQSFEPPRHPSGMQAMLEHSLHNYKPLPSELRLRRSRSRVNSRPSPYPRSLKTSFTSSPASEHLRATVMIAATTDCVLPRHPSPLYNALQQIAVDPNIPPSAGASASECVVSGKPERVFGLPLGPRGPTTRRTASGIPRRSTGRNGTENKENSTTASKPNKAPPVVNVSQGLMIASSDGLRLNRPRPRGRPTPASGRPIRA